MSKRRSKKFSNIATWQHAGLALLVAVTIAVVGFALKGPEPDLTAAPPVRIAQPTATPTPTPTRDAAASMAALKAAVTGNQPLVISVLGDSTGNGTGEWVDLWSKHLAQYGTVTLHQWDDKADAWKPEPIVVPGSERSIVIWNGSMPGANYTYPLQRLDVIQPEKPHFVLHNFGHNQASVRADAGAFDLFAAVNKRWSSEIPSVVMLQNPARNSREQPTQYSVSALSQWTASAGVPAIDVNSAFRNAGDLNALLADDVHPNPTGSRIWADTVAGALG